VTFATGIQLETIGVGTFAKTRITSINIPASIKAIQGSYDNGAFQNCKSLSVVTFESGSQLTSIGQYTFYAADMITSITIPASVTDIGNSAFDSNSNLREFILNRSDTQLTTIGSSIFYSVYSLIIKVPAIRVDDYKVAPGWSAYADIIVAIE